MEQKLEHLNRHKENAKKCLDSVIEAYDQVIGEHSQELQCKQDTINYLIEKVGKLEDEKDKLEEEKEALAREVEQGKMEIARLSLGKFDTKSITAIDSVEEFESKMMNNYWTVLISNFQDHIKDFINKSKVWKTETNQILLYSLNHFHFSLSNKDLYRIRKIKTNRRNCT